MCVATTGCLALVPAAPVFENWGGGIAGHRRGIEVGLRWDFDDANVTGQYVPK